MPLISSSTRLYNLSNSTVVGTSSIGFMGVIVAVVRGLTNE